MLLLNTPSTAMVIDIAICAILLIFAIIGCAQGFLRQLVGLIGGIASLIIAYMFCDDLLKLIQNNYDILSPLTDKLCATLSKNSVLAAEFNPETFKTTLTDLNIPNFIINAISKLPMSGETATLANVLAIVLAKYICLAVCFVALFLICKLFFLILRKLSTLFNKLLILGSVNRLLGLLLGLVKGLLVVYFVLFAINVFAPAKLNIAEIISQTKIANALTNHNIFVYAFEHIFK